MVKTRDLLVRIGKENSLPLAKVEEIVAKLEEEWYADADSLREITDDTWKGFNVPTRLVNLIKKYLADGVGSVKISREDVFDRLGTTLTRDDLSPCISSLQQIVYNLASSPDPKYQTINLSNPKFHQRVGRFAAALQYLHQVGFIQQSSYLRIQNPNQEQSFYISMLSSLNQLATKHNLPIKEPPESFNPYKSSILSTDYSKPKIIERPNDFLKINNEINQIINNREEIKSSTKIKRNPQIYRPESSSLNSAEPNFQAIDEEIIRKEVQNFISQREKSQNFQNKRKNELEKLRNQTLITRVAIKIKFPDGFVLEGSFAFKENMQDVYFFVRSFLEYDKDFYFFTTLPKRVIGPSLETLDQYSPAVLLHFSWTDECKTDVYLKRLRT